MPNASNKLPNVPAASMACCDVRNIDVTDVSAQRSMFFALMPNTTWDFEIDSFRSDAALIDEPIAAVTRSKPTAATAPTAMLWAVADGLPLGRRLRGLVRGGPERLVDLVQAVDRVLSLEPQRV